MEIGWIHFSEEERKNAKKLAENFDDDESNDPLGLSAVIRKFSDHFFPGIVSGQKHARYYMFGLYLLEMMKEGDIETFEDLKKIFKEREKEICKGLLKTDKKTTGIIGRRTNGEFTRTPTEYHWTGIKTFFLNNTTLSLNDMIENIGKFEIKKFNKSEELFSKCFKKFNEEFKNKDLRIQCSDGEKTFIKNAILGTGAVNGTLLEKLINNRSLPNSFDEISEDDLWLPAAIELSEIINCMHEYMDAIIELLKENNWRMEDNIIEKIKNENLNENELCCDEIKGIKSYFNNLLYDFDFITKFVDDPKERTTLVYNRIRDKIFSIKDNDKNKKVMKRSGDFRYDIVKKILKDLQ